MLTVGLKRSNMAEMRMGGNRMYNRRGDSRGGYYDRSQSYRNSRGFQMNMDVPFNPQMFLEMWGRANNPMVFNSNAGNATSNDGKGQMGLMHNIIQNQGTINAAFNTHVENLNLCWGSPNSKGNQVQKNSQQSQQYQKSSYYQTSNSRSQFQSGYYGGYSHSEYSRQNHSKYGNSREEEEEVDEEEGTQKSFEGVDNEIISDDEEPTEQGRAGPHTYGDYQSYSQYTYRNSTYSVGAYGDKDDVKQIEHSGDKEQGPAAKESQQEETSDIKATPSVNDTLHNPQQETKTNKTEGETKSNQQDQDNQNNKGSEHGSPLAPRSQQPAGDKVKPSATAMERYNSNKWSETNDPQSNGWEAYRNHRQEKTYYNSESYQSIREGNKYQYSNQQNYNSSQGYSNYSYYSEQRQSRNTGWERNQSGNWRGESQQYGYGDDKNNRGAQNYNSRQYSNQSQWNQEVLSDNEQGSSSKKLPDPYSNLYSEGQEDNKQASGKSFREDNSNQQTHPGTSRHHQNTGSGNQDYSGHNSSRYGNFSQANYQRR